jgi:hypothetical protein
MYQKSSVCSCDIKRHFCDSAQPSQVATGHTRGKCSHCGEYIHVKILKAHARAGFNGCLELFMEEAIDELGVFWWNVTGLTATSSKLTDLDYALLCLIAAKHDVMLEECE